MSLLQLALNISNAIDDLYDHDEPVSEFAQFEAIYNELVSHDDYDFSDFDPIEDDTDNFVTSDDVSDAYEAAYGVVRSPSAIVQAYEFDPIPEPEGGYAIKDATGIRGVLKAQWYDSVFGPCPDGSQAAKGAK